ncbi:MAG TPA: universal stress protein [Vicinamibacterales bacterium]|nr:universal stress protein [Vicinamibacterales bacterium]
MAVTTLFKTILCPVDFSDHSRQALAYAALLASRSKGCLAAIFVESPMLVAAAVVAYDEKALIDQGRKELRRLVEKTIAPYGLRIEDVTLDVPVGQPHEEIARTAERLKCDVIVMGAHGRTGTNKLMLGSTTHRILRRSRLPVLATPPVVGRARGPEKAWPGQLVMAPIDIGIRARADALAAAVVARELGTQLELVHVLEPISSPPWLEVDADRRNLQQQRRAIARLTRLQDELKDVAVAVRVESGKPADEIAAIASSKHVGLVVMTRRRGQGLWGPRQGSISYQVLCKANTPILALPSDTAWMRRVVRRRA